MFQKFNSEFNIPYSSLILSTSLLRSNFHLRFRYSCSSLVGLSLFVRDFFLCSCFYSHFTRSVESGTLVSGIAISRVGSCSWLTGTPGIFFPKSQGARPELTSEKLTTKLNAKKTIWNLIIADNVIISISTKSREFPILHKI